jgi:hypothetical protein
VTDDHTLASLDGLVELQKRFDEFLKEKREPWRLAFYSLMTTHYAESMCCEDADVDFSTKERVSAVGILSLYCEWTCETHGSRPGVYWPTNLVYREVDA